MEVFRNGGMIEISECAVAVFLLSICLLLDPYECIGRLSSSLFWHCLNIFKFKNVLFPIVTAHSVLKGITVGLMRVDSSPKACMY